MSDQDEGKLLRDVNKASQAEGLLNNELLKESFDYLEAAYVKAWRNTGISAEDSFVRERLFQAVNIVGLVQQHLHRVIDGGKIAKVQIDQIEGSRRVRAA